MKKQFTHFGKKLLYNNYLLKNETPDDMLKRISSVYSKDKNHEKRIHKYMSNFWFMPSTPILSNAGTNRGLPISCYLNKIQDNLEGIADKWNENIWIASRGGGIGTCWSNVRSTGEKLKDKGKSSGIIPFIKVSDSLTLAISQGSLRRGSAAAYLNIKHPEIEEFLSIRKPSGDFNRKSLNIHHGIVICDEFMECVINNKKWPLRHIKTNEIYKYISARELFQNILDTRITTGEPYIIFEDTINESRPSHHKKLNLKVSQSNLCAEIVLPTGLDHKNKDRTAVCCLGSVNIEHYLEWKDDKLFIEDCLLFLDNVLEDFCNNTEPGLEHARYSAKNEKSIGLGAMGLHSFFQSRNIPFESVIAKSYNKEIFKKIRSDADKANINLAKRYGSCQDAIDAKETRRFSYMLAIAPTASISIICGGTSPCIEPWNANIFTQKTSTGSFEVKNKYLKKLLKSLNKDTDEVWDNIIENEGSVKNLNFLTEEQKNIFKTAFEIDQRYLIEFAADRSEYIDQSQSINLFLNSDVNKWDLLMLHITAWKKKIKSLYYLRSRSLQRTSFAKTDISKDNTKLNNKKNQIMQSYDECLACQ